MNIRKISLLPMIEAFFTTWALMKACRLQTGNVITGILFFLCLLFFQKAASFTISESAPKRVPITSAFFSILFTALYMSVDAHYYIGTLENRLFRLIVVICAALGFFFLFYHLLQFLFLHLRNQTACNRVILANTPILPGTTLTRKISAFYRANITPITFVICMCGFLPYFLYQFPGIMTPDSLNQLEQVLGVTPYSNHHPFLHTMLIKLLYSFGGLFTDNMVNAMAFFTFFQMCVMALAVAYLINSLRKLNLNLIICLLVTAFYAFVPYNAVFAVTVWKDVLFAGGVLLFTTALLRLFLSAPRLFLPDLCIYTLSGLMMCLFRTNGWYAFVLSLPFLLCFFKKNWKIMAPLQLAIFFTALLIKGPVMNSLQVTQPDFVESLSIPIQQLASVICNDRELTEEQWILIHSVIDTTYIKELYHPSFADNIKELVRAGNQDYLTAHKTDYLKLWLQIGRRYPGDYLYAYIQQTFGYWYPDSFYTVAENEGISASRLGISHTPIIGGPLVVKAKEIALKLRSILPIYGLLWSMGIMFWVLLVCVAAAIVRREPWKLFLYLPGLAIMATVLVATPVAYEFRYAYSLVYTLPLYLILAPISLQFCLSPKP